jgi:hypothetical protein
MQRIFVLYDAAVFCVELGFGKEYDLDIRGVEVV